MNEKFLFRQFLERTSSTYTYLLGDRASGQAILIDPVEETLQRDLQILQELKCKLAWVLETHVHADHVTSAAQLRKKTGAQVALSKFAKATGADRQLGEGDRVTVGALDLRVIETPGHTDSCLSFLWEDRVFTGDALLIRGCGRTDFQSGSSDTLFGSVREKLFRLPDETLVYPGHDYQGRLVSTIGEEKEHNPRLRLGITREEFRETMANLRLDPPAKIAIAVPLNLKLGDKE